MQSYMTKKNSFANGELEKLSIEFSTQIVDTKFLNNDDKPKRRAASATS